MRVVLRNPERELDLADPRDVGLLLRDLKCGRCRDVCAFRRMRARAGEPGAVRSTP